MPSDAQLRGVIPMKFNQPLTPAQQALVEQKNAALSQYSEANKRQVGAQANILRKEADLDMARLNLSYTVLTAPYDGYIGRRTLEPGQFVQAGQTISYLVRNQDKYITANYKETQIAHIFIGQEVLIKVDAYPGHRFRGRVTAISEATGSKYSLVPTDNAAGNFVKVQQRIPVRIDLGIQRQFIDQMIHLVGLIVNRPAVPLHLFRRVRHTVQNPLRIALYRRDRRLQIMGNIADQRLIFLFGGHFFFCRLLQPLPHLLEITAKLPHLIRLIIVDGKIQVALLDILRGYLKLF